MLVDTAIWVDHLRGGDATLVDLLERDLVSMHPFVVGEVACGHLTDREEVLQAMQSLPAMPLVPDPDVLSFSGLHRLYGRGLGWIDIHLLAAASAAGELLFTRDRRLHAAAEELGLAARL